MTEQRKKYQAAVDAVTQLRDKVQDQLDDVCSDVVTKVNTMYGPGDPSGGVIVTSLNSAVARWQSEVADLTAPDVGPLWHYVILLESKLPTLKYRLAELETKCQQERDQHVDLPLSDLSF
jgi:hypothetical protein